MNLKRDTFSRRTLVDLAVVMAVLAAGVFAALCCHLLGRGDSVVCLDDLSTGQRENVAKLLANPRFVFVEADVTRLDRQALEFDVASPDAVAQLASSASPPDCHRLPLETLRVGSAGTECAL